MTVLGIDPGNNGALATYDQDSKRILEIIDMPTWLMTVNRKQRKRVDAVALWEFFEYQKMVGCELVMVEAVGSRRKESGGVTRGYGLGLIFMACIGLKLPIETVQPAVWKKFMHVPGKKDMEGKKGVAADAMIVNRANEMLPEWRDSFRGPKGGYRVDRAEAAMLAKYCGDYQLRVPNRPFLSVETVLAYQHAETGA